jgi:hypothetical protein
MRRGLKRIACAVLAPFAACGGPTVHASENDGAGSVELPREIVLDEIPLEGCPSLDASRSADIEAVEDAERPEAVGLWVRACDPEAPGPHQPRAFDGMAYNGAYVTVVALDPTTYAPAPPLRFHSEAS